MDLYTTSSTATVCPGETVLPVQSSVTKPAWNVAPRPQPCRFEDVMSEQLACCLQQAEEGLTEPIETISECEFVQDNFALDDPNCQNDLVLAQMLQAEYDKEHDVQLGREERKFNGSSKVTVSFKNYRKLPEYLDSDSETDDDDFVSKHWDSFERGEKNSPTIGKSGISKQGSVITTKHDAEICGRVNACRVMAFPPGFETGDGGAFDMTLPNRVFNQLKAHSASEEKRNKRIHDKVEKSTAVEALDPKTRLLLFKLINAEVLENVNGCVSTGKESVIFHADGGRSEDINVPAECAIKVFKTTLNEFKTRNKYIRDDFRFRDRLGKQNHRNTINLWAEKEMHNLLRLKKGGIRCPDVVILKKHVLVMSFVGHNHVPAPKLKDARLSPDKIADAYTQLLETVRTMYDVCKLVHADLSEYNVLWYNERTWIIDVSQSVEVTHPLALGFLYRDCTNISNFFSKAGVPNVSSPAELFHLITKLGVPEEGTELLSKIQDFERNKELITMGMTDKPYPFEIAFGKKNSLTKHQLAVGDDEESETPVKI